MNKKPLFFRIISIFIAILGAIGLETAHSAAQFRNVGTSTGKRIVQGILRKTAQSRPGQIPACIPWQSQQYIPTYDQQNITALPLNSNLPPLTKPHLILEADTAQEKQRHINMSTPQQPSGALSILKQQIQAELQKNMSIQPETGVKNNIKIPNFSLSFSKNLINLMQKTPDFIPRTIYLKVQRDNVGQRKALLSKIPQNEDFPSPQAPQQKTRLKAAQNNSAQVPTSTIKREHTLDMSAHITPEYQMRPSTANSLIGKALVTPKKLDKHIMLEAPQSNQIIAPNTIKKSRTFIAINPHDLETLYQAFQDLLKESNFTTSLYTFPAEICYQTADSVIKTSVELTASLKANSPHITLLHQESNFQTSINLNTLESLAHKHDSTPMIAHKTSKKAPLKNTTLITPQPLQINESYNTPVSYQAAPITPTYETVDNKPAGQLTRYPTKNIQTLMHVEPITTLYSPIIGTTTDDSPRRVTSRSAQHETLENITYHTPHATAAICPTETLKKRAQKLETAQIAWAQPEVSKSIMVETTEETPSGFLKKFNQAMPKHEKFETHRTPAAATLILYTTLQSPAPNHVLDGDIEVLQTPETQIYTLKKLPQSPITPIEKSAPAIIPSYIPIMRTAIDNPPRKGASRSAQHETLENITYYIPHATAAIYPTETLKKRAQQLETAHTEWAQPEVSKSILVGPQNIRTGVMADNIPNGLLQKSKLPVPQHELFDTQLKTTTVPRMYAALQEATPSHVPDRDIEVLQTPTSQTYTLKKSPLSPITPLEKSEPTFLSYSPVIDTTDTTVNLIPSGKLIACSPDQSKIETIKTIQHISPKPAYAPIQKPVTPIDLPKTNNELGQNTPTEKTPLSKSDDSITTKKEAPQKQPQQKTASHNDTVQPEQEKLHQESTVPHKPAKESALEQPLPETSDIILPQKNTDTPIPSYLPSLNIPHEDRTKQSAPPSIASKAAIHTPYTHEPATRNQSHISQPAPLVINEATALPEKTGVSIIGTTVHIIGETQPLPTNPQINRTWPITTNNTQQRPTCAKHQPTGKMSRHGRIHIPHFKTAFFQTPNPLSSTLPDNKGLGLKVGLWILNFFALAATTINPRWIRLIGKLLRLFGIPA